MSDDLEACVHHAITHNGETYIKLADASVTFSLYRKDIAAKDARIEKLEAALRVYKCSGKCANCYGAVRNTKYCGQIARAALEGGEDE